ncbi:lysylphosphatidylglycerol synthase domain-containing protein [Syntrophotalea acetylenivorans]|uniref:lysylphosphatidylglycerol synthase domain-containing protein n=1 Tax=Syntrophotalea acetylenivorans TaxID=1842532 RepID=UPI000931F555|nr:lysylphosphatidylglycerol synthase domain-containing protein [Syntrophotalea acetylenivorans]
MNAKKIISFFGIFLSVISCIYFIYYFKINFSEIPRIEVYSNAYLYFSSALFLSFLPILLGGLSWHLLLGYTKITIPIKTSLFIFATSQFAKYLPGNFTHHIGRVAIASSYGLKISRVLYTMVLEFYLTLISSFILSIISLRIIDNPSLSIIPLYIPKFVKLIILSSIIFISIFSCIWIFRGKLALPFKSMPEIQTLSTHKKVLYLKNILLYILSFFSIGIVINILAVGIFNAPQINVCFLTSIFSIAWLSGFVTPGAPAGFGVRETVLVTLLEPFYGPGIAIGVSAFLRIITTSSDGLSFSIALACKKSGLILKS